MQKYRGFIPECQYPLFKKILAFPNYLFKNSSIQMHQNIKINHTRAIDAKLYNGKYYDFMLYKGECASTSLSDLDGMAIADFSTFDIASGVLYSTVTWPEAKNSGVDMEDIGMTGVDNGLIAFNKYAISNKEFLDIYFRSKYHIESGDTRFFMSPITGNTQEYTYPMYLVNESGTTYIAFKGGFYQGFFGLEGFDYQTLPYNYNGNYLFHFDLRPRSDYEVEDNTVNAAHPENEGIFFFMGTRAENKFFPFYKESSATTAMKKEEVKPTPDVNKDCDWLLNEDKNTTVEYEPQETYFVIGDGYFIADEEDVPLQPSTEVVVVEKENEKKCTHEFVGSYKLNTYDFNPDGVCSCKGRSSKGEDKPEENECGGPKAVEIEYVGKDTHISKKLTGYTDSEDHPLTDMGGYVIESDNKFLLFDRASGFTTENWVEGSVVRLYGKKNWPSTNYFLLFNQGPTGYTTETIDQYNEEHGKEFNVYKDIRNNVFALRIKEDGSIGYRYGVLSCDEDNENHYEVKEEYSKPGVIKFDKWNSVNVKFSAMGGTYEKCDPRSREMQIKIYVNGFLVFISKPLNSISFKALDEIYTKQEAVPYNMSLGGGSLGLIETILPDYFALPEYILPIERDFCGTFLGDIKSFKIYQGGVDYSAIANYLS